MRTLSNVLLWLANKGPWKLILAHPVDGEIPLAGYWSRESARRDMVELAKQHPGQQLEVKLTR